MTPDHYAVLEVASDADQRAVRAAYLRAMRASHPDHRPGDAVAADHARSANAAWAVLGDVSRRASYDRARSVADTGRLDARTTAHALRETAAAHAAYSPAGDRYRRAFHAASVKVSLALFLMGLVLLLAVGSL